MSEMNDGVYIYRMQDARMGRGRGGLYNWHDDLIFILSLIALFLFRSVRSYAIIMHVFSGIFQYGHLEYY